MLTVFEANRWLRAAVAGSAMLVLSMAAYGSPDWPQWRYDEGRRAATPHVLPGDLQLHWVRTLEPPLRAWPQQLDDFDKLAFDKSYAPVAAGGLVFVSSMVSDRVTAYDIQTGEERWRFYTDGPVRLAPSVWEGRVYFSSDDSYLYCLDAQTGEQVWRFKGGPGERLVLGNLRLVNLWSSRGAPVIVDGTLYFAAGIWPGEGIFIYALDAATGEIIWANTGSGVNFDLHQHGGAYAFGGIAPQGYFAVAGDKLLVTGGRTPPAVLDRHTGEFLYYRQSSGAVGKAAGGYRVYAQDDWFFNLRDPHTTLMYNLGDGAQLGEENVQILTDDAFIGVREEMPFAYSSEVVVTGATVEDRLQRAAIREEYELVLLWEGMPVEGLERFRFKAGPVLYGSGPGGKLFAMDLPDASEPPSLRWTEQVEGEVFSMIAAHERLIVSTEDGKLYCFGPGSREPIEHPYEPAPLERKWDEWETRAADVLDTTGMTDGFALMIGAGSGRLLEELLRQSSLHVIVFEPDSAKAQALRERLDAAGMYGRRASVLHQDFHAARIPPYIASLVVSEDLETAGYRADPEVMARLFHPLRPYGGAAYLPARGTAGHARFARAVTAAGLERAAWSGSEDYLLLRREGRLPRAGQWSHQYSDAANTNYSPDDRVKAPLGIVWYGSTSNNRVLPRHMNGPVPHVVEGRLIILGKDHISARCVYTGRQLWSVELPLVGVNFTSLEHEAMPAPVYFPNHPGANFIGSPYVTAPDSVYILYEDRLLRLDLDSGEQLGVFDMPDIEELVQHERTAVMDEIQASYAARLTEGEEKKRWGYLGFWDDLLIAGAYPHMFDDQQPGREGNWNATSSEFVVAMNRFTGEIQWVHQSKYGFRHNAIVTAAGRTFVLDNLSQELLEQMARRGIVPETSPEIRALDTNTGEVQWSYGENIFGTWLSYSEEYDALLQAGRLGGRRPLEDEPRERMLVLRGSDGTVLWDEAVRHEGPAAMHAGLRRIISGRDNIAVDMLSGEVFEPLHPITDLPEPWRLIRTYGCGSQNVSEHLIKFRSGAAGFADIRSNAGSSNISGFRSGCTNNLIAADGVFNAPDYTRSCSCSYQLQTSLALVNMPEVEWWSMNTYSDPEPGTIRRVALNFGAPGARLADDGILWLDYPRVGGPAPVVPVEVTPQPENDVYRKHTTLVAADNGGYSWVGSSGLKGARKIALGGFAPLTANPGSEATYQVRLHFSEPEPLAVGQRKFDIKLQGETVVSGFDIVEQAGGPDRTAVATFDGVRLADADSITIELAPADGAEYDVIISGLEVRIEE